MKIACVQTSPISFVATKEIGDVCTQARMKMALNVTGALRNP